MIATQTVYFDVKEFYQQFVLPELPYPYQYHNYIR